MNLHCGCFFRQQCAPIALVDSDPDLPLPVKVDAYGALQFLLQAGIHTPPRTVLSRKPTFDFNVRCYLLGSRRSYS